MVCGPSESAPPPGPLRPTQGTRAAPNPAQARGSKLKALSPVKPRRRERRRASRSRPVPEWGVSFPRCGHGRNGSNSVSDGIQRTDPRSERQRGQPLTRNEDSGGGFQTWRRPAVPARPAVAGNGDDFPPPDQHVLTLVRQRPFNPAPKTPPREPTLSEGPWICGI